LVENNVGFEGKCVFYNSKGIDMKFQLKINAK